MSTALSKRRWWLDTGERVGTSFVIAFLTVWLPPLAADGATIDKLGDLGLAGQATVAGVFAAGSFIKALLASRVGNPDSASLHPKV